jgi:dihydrodiol dehydrogenase / D-xylose 1-dehydrogenase (NADP)
MATPTHWGILGTGSIARLFTTALQSLDDARVVAVGSRAQETADAFGDQFAIPRRHASYEALAADPEVEIIYVATPHRYHQENSILCLNAGKAVLCEKPFTINRQQAEAVIAVARQRKRFLMEAMWTRFIPAVKKALEWIDQGAIGEVRMVQASFGFRDQDDQLFDPYLGGGSLLDVGIYPINLAHMAFAKSPMRIESLATLGKGGVDEQAGMLLGYEGGGLAILASAIQTQTPTDATLMGTEGMIRLGHTFWDATEATLLREGMEPEVCLLPHRCNGYEYEAEAVHGCLHSGQLECAAMTHQMTLDILTTMDTIRSQWGLRYPME